MKKTVALLAGMLLASGTVLGADITLNHTKFEATYNLMDSINGTGSTYVGKTWDANLRFRAAVGLDLGESGKITTLIDLSNVDEGDNEDIENRTIRMNYVNSFKDFELAIGGVVFDGRDKELNAIEHQDVEFDHDNDHNTDPVIVSVPSTTVVKNPISLSTLATRDSYIKWNVLGSKKLSLTYYPYAIDMAWKDWDTEETFKGKTDPGMEVDYKINDNTDVELRVATMHGNDTSAKENKFAYRATLNTKVAGITLNTYYGFNGEEKSVIEDTNNPLVKVAYGVMANKTFGEKLTVQANFNSETVGAGKAKVWMFGKASYVLPELKGYEATAFASGRLQNKEVASYDGDLKGDSWGDPGQLLKLNAGVKLAQGNFSVTPNFTMYSAEKEVFVKKGSATHEKTATAVGITFAHEVWN